LRGILTHHQRGVHRERACPELAEWGAATSQITSPLQPVKREVFTPEPCWRGVRGEVRIYFYGVCKNLRRFLLT
jgi:hypothetical protein